tara:strand:- start:11366 stop:12541 length:1176 start_codon:yes stop_codon:yes gene_type:complete
MYKNKILIFGWILFSFLLGCSKQNDSNEFILYGKLESTNIENVILKYSDYQNNPVVDTITVKDNEFMTKGLINGATHMMLSDYTSSNDDKNFIGFFVEPKKNYISLEENKFKEAKIVGSITQKEYEVLSKLEEPIYSEITPLLLERNRLLQKLKNSGDDSDILLSQIQNIRNDWKKKLDKIKDKRLKFAIEKPNSYLSAYFIDKYYFRSMPLDSAEFYYNSFNSIVKNSLYGQELKLMIDKSKISVRSGDLAPNFISTDLYGNEISLEAFRGKYVLLDFWASWCGPCRKANPSLKKLYRTYHKMGLEIIGLSSDKNVDDWKKAIEKDGIDMWHHIFSGKNKIEINTEYNIGAIPAYILIDRNGYIINRYLTADDDKLDIDDLKMKLEELLQ